MNCFNSSCLWLALCGVLLCSCEQPPKPHPSGVVIVLSYATRRGVKYTWAVDVARLLSQPSWEPGRGKLPLDPGRAYKLADKWISKRHGSAQLLRITLKKSQLALHAKGGLFYYVIEFEVGAFDQMPVVVLLDGLVVEPTWEEE